MKFTLDFPDSCYQDDPAGYERFVDGLQKMLNRMAMSHAKYQHKFVPPTMEEATKAFDEIRSAHMRLAMYDAIFSTDDIKAAVVEEKHAEVSTGNTENLLDAANMLVIEFCYPKHRKAHFRSQGSHESPGLEYLP